MDKREPSFSLNDFKKWMDGQSDDSARNQIGMKVESKISLKRLMDKIEPEEGDLDEVAKDFKKNGGTLVQMDGQSLQIECDSGNFTISRLFVKRQS